MALKPTHDVSIGEKRYSPEFQYHDEFERGWKSVLARAHSLHLEVTCQCGGPGRKRLQVRKEGDRFHLARYPDTGPEHAPECARYDSDLDPADDVQEEGASADLTSLKASARYLEIGFLIGHEGQIKEGTSDRESASPNRSRKIQRVSLGALLGEIWKGAGLNEWKPQWSGSRNLFRVGRRLLRAAEQIHLSGRPLADNLLIGAVKTDQIGIDRNRALASAAAASKRRILVIARLAAPKGDDVRFEALRLSNFHGLPWIAVPADLENRITRGKPVAIAHWREQLPVIALAMIAPIQNGKWEAVELALTAVNQDYVQLN